MWTVVDSDHGTIYGVSLLALCPESFFPRYTCVLQLKAGETVAKKKYQILVKDLINSKFSNAYNDIFISNISTGVVFPLQHGATNLHSH